MKCFSVCFVGVGSIAKRHISNLIDIAKQRDIELYIDALRRTGSRQYVEEYFRNIYFNYEDLPDNYNAIFITNPTEYHLESLMKVCKKSQYFFIEKPLISMRKIHQIQEMNIPSACICYVACPMRYTKVIQYIRNFKETNKILGVRCICSSYLPEWRPGIDYRDTYSANKELGGGVSIDLIHEWDYLKYLFGIPQKIFFCQGKKSSLEMDCEDTALYIAEYQDKYVELHLDYFGRESIREIMLFCEEDTIIGDLIQSRIVFLKSGKVIQFNEERDSYQKAEMEHFFEIMAGEMSDNSIIEARKTILLTQGILEDV